MTKLLKSLFPFFEYLYLFQLMEYDSWEYIKWVLKNRFLKNLQKKHALKFTQKIKLLTFASFILMFFGAITLTLFAAGYFHLLFVFALFLVFLQLSSLFILVSQVLIYPLEIYQKNKIINLAKVKLSKMPSLKIVAITGSYGKTSTKNILYTLLWKKFKVIKTPRSYNNPLSLAQTILDDLKEDSEIFIAEIGAYKIGEIAKIIKWLKPDISIITAVAPQHLEKFGSIENIAKAKFELFHGLKKGGIAILNGDSIALKRHYDTLVNHSVAKTLIYGEGREYFVSDISVRAEGTSFKLQTPKGSRNLQIPLIGEHHAKNFLPGVIASLNLGMNLDDISKRAVKLLPTPHRLEIRKQGEMTIIDNGYNTNPESAKTSFKLLGEISGEQKIIVTPGLIELGAETLRENVEFAKNAAEVADIMILVGETNKKILVMGLREAGFPENQIKFASSTLDAFKLLPQISKPKSVVLIENDLPDQYI